MLQTKDEAIQRANDLAAHTQQSYGVQEWKRLDGPSDFIVAHGCGDGIGLTVYCALPQLQ